MSGMLGTGCGAGSMSNKESWPCPVSWKDVQAFLAKANAMQSVWTVRLPTEAEWEYAARAGSTGETYGPPGEIAWSRSRRR